MISVGIIGLLIGGAVGAAACVLVLVMKGAGSGCPYCRKAVGLDS